MKTMKISSLLLSTVLLFFVFTSCPNSSPIPTEFTITYDENGADSGTTPDDQVKTEGIDITLASNSGALSRTGFTFVGWNTAVDGTGSDYAEGSVYSIDADLDLYAKWTALPTYTITYNANDATSGSAPADQVKIEGIDITLASNSGALSRTGFTFAGWNTASDGNGTHYEAGGTYSADAAATLYAEWTVTEATLAAALDPAQTGSTDYDFNYASGDSASSISGDYTLPVLVSYGTDKIASIAWTEQSDPENNVALSGTGNRNVTVIRSATDKTVALRAAITAEGMTATKDIDFTILAATTGIISGSVTWNSLTPGDIQYLAGAVVTAADTTAMTPAAGTASTDVSGAYSIDAGPGSYYVSINFGNVSFPPSGDPDYRVSIGGVLVSEGGIYTRAGEDCRVDSDNYHLRSLITYSVSIGTTTTVNFFFEGY